MRHVVVYLAEAVYPLTYASFAPGDDGLTASFQTPDGIRYDVTCQQKSATRWDVSFERNIIANRWARGATTDTPMPQSNADVYRARFGDQGDVSATVARSVLATVMEVVKRLLAERPDIQTLTFTADTPQRVRIYRALVQRILPSASVSEREAAPHVRGMPGPITRLVVRVPRKRKS